MRNEPATLLEAPFSPKLKTYILLGNTLGLVASIIGIFLLPIWAFFGPWWARRHFESLGCTLTERTVVVRRGVLIKSETTIPLDKIQDISLREGPLLRRMGLAKLRIETAGQNVTATGTAEADLVGLADAREVRDRILMQRDLLATHGTATAVSQDRHMELLEEIRDALHRIEASSRRG